jgi:hypothetical protein
MAEKHDESDESEPSAKPGLPGNDEYTEKGEAQHDVADEAATDAAEAIEPSATKAAADADADAESDAKSNADAKSDADADANAKSDDDEPAADKPTSTKPAAAAKEKGGGSRWWVILIVVLVAEFYVYGRRGEIEVCVGKQGVHDFSLMGQERTDDTRWKFPRCESRTNLGLRSQYDELVEDATTVACRGATLFRNRGEGPQCVAQESEWQRQIETSYIWPWDSRYYEHLLWFVFDE